MIVIIIAFGIIIFGGALGGTVWFVLHARHSAMPKKATGKAGVARGLTFRWRYVILPIAFLFLSAFLSLVFYFQLPAEVATHFQFDGTPDRWLSREITLVWVLAPQLLLALAAIIVTRSITRIGFLFQPGVDTWVRPDRLLLFMGNVVAFPQLILFFTMLDIFSYNSYQIHIILRGVFLLIVLGLATIALGVFLAFTILKAKRQLVPRPNQKTTKEK